METARNKTRLYKWLIVSVLVLGLANTAGADTVYTPMEQDLDANGFNISGVNDLDADGDITAAGGISTIGSELLADPGFDNANEWTDPGGCWTVSGGVASSCPPPGYSLTEVNPFTVKANTVYLVEVENGVASGGAMTISLGGVTTEAFGGGSHTFLIETTNTNSFSLNKMTGASPCFVTGLSVKEVGTAELGDAHIYLDLTVDEDIDANNVAVTDDLSVGDDVSVGGNADITGTVSTTSDDNWDFNDYTADPNATAAGYITVTINGTEYRLLATPAP
jgi:hypothetical protein